MFQYAVTMPFLKKGGVVYLDCYFLKANNIDTDYFSARNYALGLFANLQARKAKLWQVKFLLSKSIFFKFLRGISQSWVSYIKQQENEYIPFSNVSDTRHIYLDGYFQSEKYFKDYRQEILHDFQFPSLDSLNKSVKEKIENSPNSVSIHIRRGDYLKPDIGNIHGLLPMVFYENAFTMLMEKYPSPIVFVFSDDIGWARENLNLKATDAYFVDNNRSEDSWKDMALMSFCKHHIIANSSFSWWGAWLSEQKGDVFAPCKWFNSQKIRYDIHDFIPDSWTIVEYE